jgi:hypothetical protein
MKVFLTMDFTSVQHNASEQKEASSGRDARSSLSSPFSDRQVVGVLTSARFKAAESHLSEAQDMTRDANEESAQIIILDCNLHETMLVTNKAV